jgi:hypothetical protein
MTFVLWAILARRYRKVPSVLFELCGEPHPLGSRDAHDELYRGLRPTDTTGWINLWQRLAKDLLETIRGVVPAPANERVAFVGSVVGTPEFGWSSSLEGMPIADVDNVICAAHLYPPDGLPAAASDQSVDDYRKAKRTTLDDLAKRREAVLGLPAAGTAAPAPSPPPPPKTLVFISEWGPRIKRQDAFVEQCLKGGGAGPNSPRLPVEDIAYITEFDEQLRRWLTTNGSGLVGWTAWGWSEDPVLVALRCKPVTTPPCPNRPAPASVTGWAKQGNAFDLSPWGDFVRSAIARLGLP